FLAGIGIDAGEANRQRRIAMHANPAHAVEHRLAGLERHLEGLPASRLAVEPTPDFQHGDMRHMCLKSLTRHARARPAHPSISMSSVMRMHCRVKPGNDDNELIAPPRWRATASTM